MTSTNIRIAERQKMEKSGREWEVTIIGAKNRDQLVEVDGRQYVLSRNRRLYSVDAIRNAVKLFERKPVYDAHVTDEDIRAGRQRKPNAEWLAQLADVRFEAEPLPRLVATMKTVDPNFREKLINAYEADLLDDIGLSIDATADLAPDPIQVNGEPMPVIDRIMSVESVDFVVSPAAGGEINRVTASTQMPTQEDYMSTEKEVAAEQPETAEGDGMTELRDTLAAISQRLDALESKPEPVEEPTAEDEEEEETLNEKDELAEMQESLRLEIAGLKLEKRLAESKLPAKFEEKLRKRFVGRVFSDAELKEAIADYKELAAEVDVTGRVQGAGKVREDISVGTDEADKRAFEIGYTIFGDQYLQAIANDNADVAARVSESVHTKMFKNGKIDRPRYRRRMSTIVQEMYNGNPFLEPRLRESISTSVITNSVQDAVNVIAAHRYSQREEWWQAISNRMVVDNIDDLNLVRTFGIGELALVNEGQAYLDKQISDAEEVAEFTKHGNLVSLTWEAMMKDKIGTIQAIPGIMSNAWFNTLSDKVANVFLANAGVGPTLSDTGALFNNVDLDTTGGHKNLGDGALSYSNLVAANTAMMKQTDEQLGAGRRLGFENRFTHVLVPVELYNEARTIANSDLIPQQDASSGTDIQSSNDLQGMFQVVLVPTFTDTNNYALVNANIPAIHTVLVRGYETPRIITAGDESSGTMFTNDSIRYKIQLMTFSFNGENTVAPVSDFRPLYKQNVAGA